MSTLLADEILDDLVKVVEIQNGAADADDGEEQRGQGDDDSDVRSRIEIIGIIHGLIPFGSRRCPCCCCRCCRRCCCRFSLHG